MSSKNIRKIKRYLQQMNTESEVELLIKTNPIATRLALKQLARKTKPKGANGE